MTSIAELEGEGRREEGEVPALPSPADLASMAVELAFMVTKGCSRELDMPVPHEAYVPLVTHLEGWLRNVAQGAQVDGGYAAYLSRLGALVDRNKRGPLVRIGDMEIRGLE